MEPLRKFLLSAVLGTNTDFGIISDRDQTRDKKTQKIFMTKNLPELANRINATIVLADIEMSRALFTIFLLLDNKMVKLLRHLKLRNNWCLPKREKEI